MLSEKTIIIFGSNGMLGQYVSRYFNMIDFRVICLSRKEVDATKITYNQLHRILKEYHGAYVINCIGKIPQRGDTELKSYLQVNAIFPHMLSSVCNQIGNKLIHITTDCVYNGKKGKYIESDLHDETNFYGMSKSLGEPDNCCIIRTSIIGEEKENKKSLLEWVKSQCGKTINGYTNHFWNGVTCLQLAKIIHDMIDKNILWKGVRHIFSPDTVSKYQLIKMINEIYILNIKIEPIVTRNVDKSLDTTHDKLFYIASINDQIIALKEFSDRLA